MELVINLLIIGMALGSMNALLAVSFAIIYNVTHTLHLAHGGVFIIAGYVIYFLTNNMHLTFPVSFLIATLIAAFLGIAIEAGLYRPLRSTRHSSGIMLLLVSIGLLFTFEGVISILFGPAAKDFSFLPLSMIQIGAVSFSSANLAMFSSWLLVAAVVLWFARSKTGKLLRAVGDSPDAAEQLGISLDKVFAWAFAVGSALLIPVVVFYGWWQGLAPSIGLDAMLIAAAAVIIGGRHGVLPGAIVAFAIGILQSLVLVVAPTGWEQGITFAILVGVLFLRPQGIFGEEFRW